MTVEELHCIANDSINYHYTNKLLDMIKRKSERLGYTPSEQGQEVTGDSG